ncbi:yippee zinc-binding/DNA-binding /Mis18, centromere assembly-domain-containing protein [Xylariomycetidae sp. FL2044]|nr:yippee zinc-binding/DNA-binding /Mis18, centromere assembly-domain-containing protein [Xylariomycetidae sp. FL2044]
MGDPKPPPPTNAGSGPKFPIYLLPSFNMPFRRPRQSSLSSTAATSPPADEPPSLSSSPTDSALSTSPTASPSSLARRFPLTSDILRRAPATDAPPDLTATAKLSRIQPDTIRCSTCATDLAFSSQIVSKGFTGRHGRAYLVSAPGPSSASHHTTGRDGGANLVNIRVGRPETRVLVTGSHVVADITCGVCHAKVGWKYVDAKEELQKYKIGKFILETQRTVDYRSWEDVAVDGEGSPEGEEELEGTVDVMNWTEGGKVPAPVPAPVRDALGRPVVFDSGDEDECDDLFAGTWDAEVVAQRRNKRISRQARQSTRH